MIADCCHHVHSQFQRVLFAVVCSVLPDEERVLATRYPAMIAGCCHHVHSKFQRLLFAVVCSVLPDEERVHATCYPAMIADCCHYVLKSPTFVVCRRVQCAA